LKCKINKNKKAYRNGMELICTSCNTHVMAKKGYVKFKCPNCGEAVIVRCYTCKMLSRTYKCPKCGFEGP